MHAELLKPRKERAWGWPAVANFVLGGSGAGLYLIVSFTLFAGPESFSRLLPGPVSLLPAALVGLGFFAVSLESGRPWRGTYLLSNLRNSWMSIEILSGAIFIAAAALDHFFSLPVLKVAAACAALELVISHGFIIYRARAMSAWNVPIIPFLFLSSGLVLGGGVLFTISSLQRSMIHAGVISAVLVCLIADFTAWGLYIWLPRNMHFRKATAYLRRPLPLFSVMGLGHLLPLILLTWLAATAGESADDGIRHLGIALAGFCMLAGGAAQKIVVLLGANFLRGVTMGARGDNLLREKSHIGKI